MPIQASSFLFFSLFVRRAQLNFACPSVVQLDKLVVVLLDFYIGQKSLETRFSYSKTIVFELSEVRHKLLSLSPRSSLSFL